MSARRRPQRRGRASSSGTASRSGSGSAREPSVATVDAPPTSQPTGTAAAEPPPAAVDDPVALVVSHRLESGPTGAPPYTATIRLTGRRRGVAGRLDAADTFTTTETVARVVPGSGPMSTTTWVYGIAAGEWDVSAEVVGPERARAANPAVLQSVGWSWRRWAMVGAAGPARTRWALTAPLAAAPGVLTGSFLAAAIVAMLGSLLAQPVFLTHHGVPVGPAVAASLLALVVGLAGAKAWYMLLKGPSLATLREGWSVDGFLVSAPIVAAATAIVLGVPLGGYLDAITPTIFLAVAVGRIGCFLTGCCAGRITAGRGIWSSDRRVGARRVPAQLIESGVGLALASVTTLLVLGRLAEGTGVVFLGSVAVYVAARQALLRIRAESRRYSWRRSARRAAAG